MPITPITVTSPKIILASASPRRRALLEQIGVSYRAIHADIDETAEDGETAQAYARRLALVKAKTVQGMLPADVRLPVLGADTVVEISGEILTKPLSEDEGMGMLGKLSGKRHRVYTAVALVADKELIRLSATSVVFRNISVKERRAYWLSGEPRGKAGGYAIQGVGAIFVRHIEGSYSGVMGLPLFETAELLETCGVKVMEGLSYT